MFALWPRSFCCAALGLLELSGTESATAYGHLVDDLQREEQLRRNKRRPIEETLKELGEGRGRSFYTGAIEALPAKQHRYLWPWLRGTSDREVEETLWG